MGKGDKGKQKFMTGYRPVVLAREGRMLGNFLGLAESTPDCYFATSNDELRCVPWAYGCMSAVAIISASGYRRKVQLPNQKWRWVAIFVFFLLPLTGIGLLAESPGIGLHWVVSSIMLLGMVAYMAYVVCQYSHHLSSRIRC